MGEPVFQTGSDTETERGDKKDVLTTAQDVSPSESDKAVSYSEPPDGEFGSWVQVSGSWVALFNTWGIVNSFGIFQTYYEEVLLTTSSSSDIAWVGSIQACLLLVGGIISGPLFDAGYFRHLMSSGLFLIAFGQFMTSLCSTYWQVLLAQGICVGVGCGLVFLPSTAIIVQYFSRRKALATGIASTGSPIAGMILPIVFSRLEPLVGFGWANRVIAFIFLGLSIIPVMFMRTRLPPSKRVRALIDPSALRDPKFVIYLAGACLAFMSAYIPFFYVELFTVDHGFTTRDFSSYMVTFANAGSIFGRLVPTYFADRLGHTEVMSLCTYGASILAFGWLGVGNFAGAVVFAIIYGFFAGGIVSLNAMPVFILSAEHMDLVGTRLGMLCFIMGVGVLIGEPIAGAILGGGERSSEWDGLIGFTAATLVVSASFILATAILLRRSRRQKGGD